MSEAEAMRAHVGERTAETFMPVTLDTPDGEVRLRWYDASSSRAVAYVGGAGGDWDSPARELYPRLCSALVAEGLSGLRVRFRDTRDLPACVSDLLAAMAFLRHVGVARVGLVGHSLGAAVAMRAASLSPEADTVVGLASQSRGANADELPRGCSLLLIHGQRDTIVPPSASERLFAAAPEPKRLVLIPGAGHVLDEAAEQVAAEVRAWLLSETGRDCV